MRYTLPLAAILVACMGSICMSQPAKPAAAPPAPCGAVPTQRQMAWFEREMIAFAHFGVNTFTDREWGEGKEDPAIFNPTALDARQWARACKAGGLRMLILTAKHHDGFCLWPSKLTEHSVRSSPWRGGKGDVVREAADACRAEGLDFGVYLSPWDRHEPSYGDSPRYNAYYMAQLEELLTGYGTISEMWFDGACGEGPNGKRQVYDFQAYWDRVRALQPACVMFSDVGPDVRWVGNEKGYAADPNWITIDRSRMKLGGRNPEQTHGVMGAPDCVPTEVDVSIRPGWFYHAAEDGKVKSLETLLDIYYNSVGMNGVLLLNIPPDRRGLMHENDAARLAEFKAVLDETFARDLARGKACTASNTRGGDAAYAPALATDGDAATYWAADDGVMAATLEADLGGPATFDRAEVREFIRLGQRVKAFRVEALVGGQWKELARGQTIGRKRLLRFPSVEATKVRLVIDDALACPTIATLALYKASPRDTMPKAK
jgi:alpha-L-fucosidase